MKTSPIRLAAAICCATAALATTSARADATDDLRAELKAQRATMEAQRDRLDKLERMLEAATKEAVAARSQPASQAAASTGPGMPKGLSIYGIADAGVEAGDYGKGTKTRVQSGLGSASRLGFRGQREFGDGLSAYFQLEAGVSIDNGQNTGHFTQYQALFI